MRMRSKTVRTMPKTNATFVAAEIVPIEKNGAVIEIDEIIRTADRTNLSVVPAR